MIYYDKSKYSCVLTDADVFQLEQQCKVQFLYGGAIGTQVFEAANVFSDFDFLFVYKIKNQKKEFNVVSMGPSIEISCFNVEKIEQANFYDGGYRWEFPTFYTTKRRKPNEDRDIEFFRIFSSDYVWDSGYLKEGLSSIEKMINPVLILDYLFSRTAGNLEKSLSIDMIPTKAIIRTMYNLNCMLWILKNQTYPYLNLEKMIEEFHFGREKRKMLEILQYHKDYDIKNSKPVVRKEQWFNNYIETCLKKIENVMHTINFDQFHIKIDNRSFLAKCMKD